MDRVDVLVVGGGCSGAAAAWQAARAGASVLVLEESPWLGGMVTAAGVAALDGNEGALGSGFFRRFRSAIEAHYGGADKVRTGWVSNTCFEPAVGARILARFVAETGAQVLHGARFREAIVEGTRITGARYEHAGQVHEVRAHVVIEATEYGDVLLTGGVPHRFGREAQSDTREPHAPLVADLEVQDPTWVAILRPEAHGHARAIEPIPEHDPREFDGATSILCSNPDPAYWNHGLHDWNSFITYGALATSDGGTGKFMLNWPFHSNDFPIDLAMYEPGPGRAEVFRRAKRRTLAFVRYMQRELGHPEWGIWNEFGTDDGLPFMPYVRESRRVVAVETVGECEVVPLPGKVRPRLSPTAIAVGDYFLDHHHAKAHLPPDRRLVEDYPKNAPFQIPYGALVSRTHDGLVCAEKTIGSTHIANGCTRLQPVVMQIGQAAGMAAALCAQARCEPRELHPTRLQEALVREGSMLMPFRDVGCDDPRFEAEQLAYARGTHAFDEATPLVR
jgi:hypothetical protein